MVEKSETGQFWPSLHDPFQRIGARMADWLTPASEASVQDDAYRIAIELPGVAEEDIDVSVHDGVVRVRGEKKTSHEEESETWYFSERQFGSFSRSFRVPPDADQDAVEAGLDDGVLTLVLPKRSEPETSARSVKVAKGKGKSKGKRGGPDKSEDKGKSGAGQGT